MATVIMSDEERRNMDKKIKAFFAAMGIATALLVSVPASADNSDSKVQVSIDITWDSLEFTYTDGQWDPETHSYKGGGWSDSGGNFTLTNTGNVGVMADFSYKQAEGMDEIKGEFFMSAKNSFNSMDPKAMQALLAVASKKLGTTPDVLKGQLESGVYDRALQGMPQNEAMMLQKALSDPKTAEKILSSPQARAIFKKLQGK